MQVRRKPEAEARHWINMSEGYMSNFDQIRKHVDEQIYTDHELAERLSEGEKDKLEEDAEGQYEDVFADFHHVAALTRTASGEFEGATTLDEAGTKGFEDFSCSQMRGQRSQDVPYHSQF